MNLTFRRLQGRSSRSRQGRGVAVIAAGLVMAAGCVACGGPPLPRPAGPGPGREGPGRQGPPPLTVLRPDTAGGGVIFLAPVGGGYTSGPEILTVSGKIVWSHPLPMEEQANDFRSQTYEGGPVLTWFQGRGLDGTDYIYNGHYQRIAQVKAGHGYFADFHEFLITPWNTALVLADTLRTANLTSMGGPPNQKVFSGIVEEIDIRTGKVLFQWDSWAHVPYRDSHKPLPASAAKPWDWFHINAVHLDTDGNLLINSRFTWTTYKVSLRTGKTIWELGGKQSSFKLLAAPGQTLDSAGEIFAFQHDPEALGHGVYTFFDDESDGQTRLLPHSRVVFVKLDLNTKVATLVKSFNQPEGLVAAAEGNAQTTANGDVFVDWGALPYLSEFSPAGKLLFNARLPTGVNTYRAYRLAWPRPANPAARSTGLWPGVPPYTGPVPSKSPSHDHLGMRRPSGTSSAESW